MPDEPAERDLLARIRRGEPAAWETFIAAYEGRLMAYVDRRLKDRAGSEDVVQETFLGFLVSLPNYDESTPLESWLFSIAAHKLTDLLRRQGRRPALPLAASDEDGGTYDPPGRARRASSLVRSGERRTSEERVLGDALAGLVRGWLERGEHERLQCIELLFVAGRANKDAARELGISEQAVANHKQFVVSKLKDAARRAGLEG